MNHALIACPRCGREVSPSPSGDGAPVPHYIADTVRPCAACECPMPQPGWAAGRCSTCQGDVSYEVWTASYPGRPGRPRPEEEIRFAILVARAGPQGSL